MEFCRSGSKVKRLFWVWSRIDGKKLGERAMLTAVILRLSPFVDVLEIREHNFASVSGEALGTLS